MWIKICGITDAQLACQVASLGPDAIGLNFYEETPRHVSIDTAQKIVASLPQRVEAVGVFVNRPAEEIRRIASYCRLATVQLHGDEPPEFAAQLPGLKIIRAFRVGAEGLDPVAEQLARYRQIGVSLSACLVDARVEGAYGGTGHSPPWQLLAQRWDRVDWPPLILAGGLRPENVAAGITLVAPWGVDVASGVEAAPGRQDLDKVSRFIAAVRQSGAA